MTTEISPDDEYPLLARPGDGARVVDTSVNMDAVYRRIGKHVVPVCFMVTLISYIDRANLGLAAREFCADLDLSASSYATGVGLFFIFYSVFQVPSNLILERVGAPLWIGILMVVWGLCASCMALVKTKRQFYILRCMVGMAEAGAFPGIWVYLSSFFPEKHRTVPLTLVELGAIFAQIIGPAIGAGLLAMDGVWGWRGWSWLFFAEGIPAVALGIWFALRMPLSPMEAKFLSEQEQYLVKEEITRDKGTGIGTVDVLSSFRSVATNKNLWLIIMVKFFRNMTTDVIMFWTPLWINSLLTGQGLSSSDTKHSSCGAAADGPHRDSVVALLTAIPFSCAVAAGITLAWHSDKHNDKKYHIGIVYMVASVAFAALPIVSQVSSAIGFLALIVTVSGGNAPSGILVALAASYLPPDTRAIGLAVLNSVGHLGSYFGSMFVGVMKDITGDYVFSIVPIAVLLLVAGMSILLVPIGAKQKHNANLRTAGRKEDASVEMGSLGTERLLSSDNHGCEGDHMIHETVEHLNTCTRGFSSCHGS